MTINQQIGVMLDLIHDIVERDEPEEQKKDAVVKAIEANDRLGDTFAEFLTWFKLVENNGSES